MINFGYFKEGLAKVAAAFNVSNQRKEALENTYHDILSSKISDAQFTKAVEHILLNAERFPTIKAFLDVARIYPDPKGNITKEPCVVCDSTGCIVARREGYRTLFSCSECHNCEYDYPEWSDDYRKIGFKPEFRASDWNPNDDAQMRGLAMMGTGSKVWKKASKDCQQAAMKFGAKPHSAGLEAITGKADPQKERLRRQRERQIETFDILGKVRNLHIEGEAR